MKIETKFITEGIVLLVFENRKDITSTLLRFQEYYESPKFRGKIFSLDEFKKWYVKNSASGKKTGNFTYYRDWGGFNIPSYIFKDFRKGRFNPLSQKEQKVIDILKIVREPFYVIGIFKKHKKIFSLLDHELKHGLFYTNSDYRNAVQAILAKFNLKKINSKLEKKGYHSDVWLDEIQAYANDSSEYIRYQISKPARKMLKKVYNKYSPLNRKELHKMIDCEILQIQKPIHSV